MNSDISIVMIGGSGAVGREVVRALCDLRGVSKITLLGRRKIEGIEGNVHDTHRGTGKRRSVVIDEYKLTAHSQESPPCTGAAHDFSRGFPLSRPFFRLAPPRIYSLERLRELID